MSREVQINGHEAEMPQNTSKIERAHNEDIEPLIQNLRAYTPGQLERGRGKLIELLWIIVEAIFISSWVPGSWHRRIIFRSFGAKIGDGVIFKSGVHVKFPWKLSVGDYSWIGERVWIDNLADVTVGSNVCVSQGAYLCTGSHNWSLPTFELITEEIHIKDGAWIAANACIGPGVTVEEGAILSLGSVANKSIEAKEIYSGNPARRIRSR